MYLYIYTWYRVSQVSILLKCCIAFMLFVKYNVYN